MRFKTESRSLGLSEKEIEAAITAEPALALLTDLANLDKHLNLNPPPRSGDIPQIGDATGFQRGSGEGAGAYTSRSSTMAGNAMVWR
jgi:hypothetical protein